MKDGKFEASDFEEDGETLTIRFLLRNSRIAIADHANFLLEQELKAATTECDACGKTVLNE